MPRPRWTPPDDEVAARINEVVERYKRWHQAEAEYKALLAEVADPDKDNAPIAHLADRLGVERKTVYRHLGKPMK
ncbi:hypothetical protein [Micromonospora carbonacea]|uniref:hypothetical protein n=1 Tax=Micromonospora carbonacea TaxID=47853 RepID=UPI00114CE23A|nr:hypothetical protein [Micromonospora carbonacea]